MLHGMPFMILGIVIGVGFYWIFWSKKKPTCDDDPTGVKKREIFNSILKLKQDIENTV